MEIPFERLSPEALREVLEEFVTRDGTETAGAEESIARVESLLRAGELTLHFDPDSETCQLVRKL